MSAQVVNFPEVRNCHLCVHFESLGRHGMCLLFDEFVRHPRDRARRCSSFEVRPGGLRGTNQ